MGIQGTGFRGGTGTGCGSCTTSTTICVTVCTPPIAAFGVTIELLTGGSVVASCVTGGSGCCAFTQTGSFTVQVVANGTVVYSATRTLSGGTITIALGTSAGFVCCGGMAVPYNLTLTDALGSLSFVYWPGGGSPAKWTAGRLVTVSSCPLDIPAPGVCVPGTVSDGPTLVCYTMYCPTSGSVFTVQRAWCWIYESDGVTPAYYQQPGGSTAPTPGQGCSPAAPGGSCPSGTIPVSTGTAVPSSSPFAASFTMTPVGSPDVPDPVGGPVAVSA